MHGVPRRAVTRCFRLALVPDSVVLVVWMTLLHGVSLALVLVLNMEASKTQQGRVAFHVVLMDLGPQLHSPVPARGAGLTKKWRLARRGGQAVAAAKPAIVGAVNGVELVERAISAVAAHLTTGLALAVNVAITI